MYRLILLIALASLACSKAQPHATFAATNPSAPNAVNITDQAAAGGNILGTAANPLVTTGGGGGGSSSVTVINDAGNAIPITGSASITGTVSVDTTPGDLVSLVADTVAPGIQGLVKGAAAGTFVAVNACNEGTVTGWLMFFDQGGAATDGGALAGTAPTWMGLRTPAGACASLNGVRAFTNGLKWYSSGQAGTLDAGLAPNFATETFYR